MEESSGTKLLTETECLEIVQNDLKLNVKEFTLKSYRIKKGSNELVGFMGEYYKLEMEIQERNLDECRFLSYFLKSLPVDNKIYRDECERKGFFPKESSIYRNILPNIQRYSEKPLFPKSYLTRQDLIVLEDFSLPEKNLRQLELNQKYTLKHYQLLLEHLAELHAASLAWEVKEGINIGEEFKNVLHEFQLTTTNEWYITGIKSAVYLAKQHPKYQYPEALEFISHKLYDIFLNMEETTKPSSTLRNVFCHRDSWDRNIFWEYDASSEPIACRILDFQLTRYSPPAIDVLFFLYINFENPQQRSKLLPDLLLYYHESLRKSLKAKNLSENMITKSEFDKDCQSALLPVLTIRAICEPLFKLPEGWSQNMRDTEPDKFDYYINTDRTEMFSRVSQLDAGYMQTIFSPVQELMEYFGFEAKENQESVL